MVTLLKGRITRIHSSPPVNGATKPFALGVLDSGPPARGTTKSFAFGVFKYQTEKIYTAYVAESRMESNASVLLQRFRVAPAVVC